MSDHVILQGFLLITLPTWKDIREHQFNFGTKRPRVRIPPLRPWENPWFFKGFFIFGNWTAFAKKAVFCLKQGVWHKSGTKSRFQKPPNPWFIRGCGYSPGFAPGTKRGKTCRRWRLSPFWYLPAGNEQSGLEGLPNPQSRGNRQMRSLNSTDVRAPRVATLSDGFVNCF